MGSQVSIPPSFDYVELTDREWEFFNAALMTPSLWSFQLMVAAIGISEAIKACQDGPPEDVAELLRMAGYDPQVLPNGKWIKYIIPGVKMVCATSKLGKLKKSVILKEAGVTLHQAKLGYEALRFFGCDVVGNRRIMKGRARARKGCDSGDSSKRQ